MEILEWAKGKNDLAEIYYENKGDLTTILLHIVFEPGQTASAANTKALGYLRAPTIGELTLMPERARPGIVIKKGEELGQVQGNNEKAILVAPFNGTILEALAGTGKKVGYGDPVLLVEITE